VAHRDRPVYNVKKAVILLAAVGIAAAVIAFLPREKKVIISDFSWSVSGKTAPYSFSLANQTDEKLQVIVLLEAHRVTEGKDGTKLHPFGLARTEISLTARETKKAAGVIELLDFGSSATKVSYHASLK
jgi:hypothetical protein